MGVRRVILFTVGAFAVAIVDRKLVVLRQPTVAALSLHEPWCFHSDAAAAQPEAPGLLVPAPVDHEARHLV